MSSPTPEPNPATVFAEWLADHEGDDEQAFALLVQDHPEHAVQLVRMRADWMRGQRAIDHAPLSKRLEAQFGARVDPEVSLRGTDERTDSFSSEVLQRLSGRSASFGRYQLKGEIARGGMGAIVKVWDEDLHRHLAMKVILGQASAPSTGATPPVDATKVARFLEEAQVTGQLDHPGIVPVHELGLDPDGRVYFTMKLVRGQTLKHIFDLVAEGKEGWTQTKALGVLLKVCEAMAYAHDKGVIHRDLKPGNIMVGKFGEVHVMDWGLARILDKKDEKDIRIREDVMAISSSLRSEREERRGETPESPLYTMDGDVVGTPAYMPPEQAAGKVDEIGPHSDVYALGAMLYHLISGHMPYVPANVRLNNYAVWGLVQHGPPPSIAHLSPETPAELVAICDKAMARDWERRYRDMSQMAADLSAYLEHRVVGAYRTGAWAETKKWVQRNKPLAASLATAVVLLVAGLTASLVFKSRADEKEKLATQRATDLQSANTTIEERSRELAQRNTELAQATKTARANEQRAVGGEKRALEAEEIATQKANDVLSLSAIQELKELEENADKLWPAHPENLPKYETWLAKARLLIEGCAKDEGPGKPGHPSLANHEAKLSELRKRAKPQTADEMEADRQRSASYAEWTKEKAHLQWLRRMLGEELWPGESEVESELSKTRLPSDASELNNLAWPLVDTDPARIQYGGELKGLLLAKRAVASAKEADRPMYRDTLAWALFRTGHSDEARAEEERAVSEIGADKKKEYEGYLSNLEHAIQEWSEEGGHGSRKDEKTKLETRVAALEGDVHDRRTFEFDDAQDRWWHAQLSQLVADLKTFTDEKKGGLYSSGTSEKHGWGIPKRAEFAQTIEERSIGGPEARRLWEDAIAAITKSPKYGGLVMTPQMGLLPIGEDPDSHLWEFAHVQTGEAAQRGAEGKLVLDEKMALVFVLIPGGTFWMGAQRQDRTRPNYDPQARGDESPVHELTLSPYFLSKYEMTQGQWLRFVSKNPSAYGPNTNLGGQNHSLRHPVEQVTWDDCMRVLSQLGLTLPSEAQWENGCRAGTDTRWWTGAERESLRGKVNLADQSAARAGATWGDIGDWPDLDDGWAAHAPVGTFAANAFGLHEVHGNVWEWCLDGFNSGFYSRSPNVDPVAPWQGSATRVNRGGGFSIAALYARSAIRHGRTPEYRFNDLGLRPARAITP